MTEQVTSTKNAGMRFVEWNRKNKENLLKDKDQELTSNESSSQQAPTSHAALYGGGIVILVGVAVAFYLYTQQKKPVHPALDRKNDIFIMK